MFSKHQLPKKIFLFPILITIIAISLIFPLNSVNADNGGDNGGDSLQNAFQISDGSNNDPLDSAAKKAGYDTSKTSPNPIIQTAIQAALSFLGVIFLILMIYGGFLWMIARGNEEKVDEAKKILTEATIGLIIVVAAYAISVLVIEQLGENTLK